MTATPRPHRTPRFRTLLAAGALAAGAGCADNEISVYIRLMKAPTVNLGVCSVTNELNGNTTTEGILDLAFRRTYNLAPLVQNNIVSRLDNTSGRPESNHVYIEGYIVEIHEDSPTGPLYQPAGATFNNPFSVYQTLVINAAQGATPTFGATIFEALPQQIGEALYQDVCVTSMGISEVPGVPRGTCVPRYNANVLKRLILSVSAFGHTGGNVSVQTPKFDFPVTTCCGCLRNFPVAVAGTTADAGPGGVVNPSCAREVPPITPASCATFFGQDFVVPCALCSDSLPNVCEPTGHSFNATTVCPR